MTQHELLKFYLQHCRTTLAGHGKAQQFLKRMGVREGSVDDGFAPGFADGSIGEICRENEKLRSELERVGLLKNGNEPFKGCLVIPILDENKEPVNIVGYGINAQRKKPMMWLRPDGLFNDSSVRSSINTPTHRDGSTPRFSVSNAISHSWSVGR